MPTQLPLLPDLDAETIGHRTIHYLGSKLRLLNPIRRAIAAIAPPGQAVCDLFAGSGVVSLALAPHWTVTSVDIQEYSRVLGSGLVNAPTNVGVEGNRLSKVAAASSLNSRLRDALSELLEHERQYITSAAKGEIDGLCDLLEHGSLLALNDREHMPVTLHRAAIAALQNLQKQGLDNTPTTVVTRYFGGRYFSWEQAIDFDALLTVIHSLDKSWRDTYLAAALVVASDLVNTIGKHFAQPIRLRDSRGHPKAHLIKQTLRDRNLDVFGRYRAYCQSLKTRRLFKGHHRAVRSDYREFLEGDTTPFAAVYADPPYTRDHYSRYYHVLETMALGDEPGVATTKIRPSGTEQLSRGIYRLQRHQSPFCIPSKARSAFEELFRSVAKRRSPLVLSYSPYETDSRSRPRLLTIDELLGIADEYFRQVEMLPIDGISHNKLNLTERNVNVNGHAEVLICCHS